MKTLALTFVGFLLLTFGTKVYAQNPKITPKDIVGTWKIDIAATKKLNKQKGVELPVLTEKGMEQEESMRLTFSKDGNFSLESMLLKTKGTWTLEGTNLRVLNAQGTDLFLFLVVGTDLLAVSVFNVNKQNYLALALAFD